MARLLLAETGDEEEQPEEEQGQAGGQLSYRMLSSAGRQRQSHGAHSCQAHSTSHEPPGSLQRFAVGIMANVHIASGCEAVRHVG